MLLSIIVPVYNVEDFLSRCLDSLINQDLPKDQYEILIVNDGSPDSSLQIAENYQKENSNLKIISQENKGLSEARNTGFRNSTGKYVYFIDSDDYIQKNVLQNLMNIVTQLNLDFLGFGSTSTSKSDYNASINFLDIDKIEVYDGNTFIAKHNYLANAWWYIIKKEVIDSVGLQFEKGRMLEDGIYTAELLLNSKRTTFLKYDIYRYFLNVNSLTTTTYKKNNKRLNEDSIFVIHKFTELIDFAIKNNANSQTIRRLKTIQESYLFFLFIRLMRGNAKFLDFNLIITEMKQENIYPMKNFIGIDYTSKKERSLTFIFNNKILFYLFVQINSIFKIFK